MSPVGAEEAADDRVHGRIDEPDAEEGGRREEEAGCHQIAAAAAGILLGLYGGRRGPVKTARRCGCTAGHDSLPVGLGCGRLQCLLRAVDVAWVLQEVLEELPLTLAHRAAEGRRGRSDMSKRNTFAVGSAVAVAREMVSG